jgi:MFS family permease
MLFTPKERAAVFDAFGAVRGMAAVAGSLIGGALVSADAFGLGWRSVFVINLPVGILLLVASLIFIMNSKSDKPAKIDLAGVLLISVTSFSLVFALIQGREYGWPLWIWLIIGASPVLIAVFAWVEFRQDKSTSMPLIPTSLFKSRGYSAGAVTAFAPTASVASFYLIFAIYLQRGLGFSALDAGVASLPFSIGAFFGSGIAIPLAARLGKTLIFLGSLLQLGGYFWVSRVVIDRADGLVGPDLIIPLAIAGVGLTLVLLSLNEVALAETNVSDAEGASGFLNTFQQAGAAIAIAVIGEAFFGVTEDNFSPNGLCEEFDAAVWVTLGVAALTGAFRFLLPSVAQVAAHKEAAEAVEV